MWEIPSEIKDKFLMLADKLGLPTELSDKIKEELSKWWNVSVTKVEVWTDSKITPEMVDKMSPEEAKQAFKKHLEMCMKDDWVSDENWEWWPWVPKNKSFMEKMRSNY